MSADKFKQCLYTSRRLHISRLYGGIVSLIRGFLTRYNVKLQLTLVCHIPTDTLVCHITTDTLACRNTTNTLVCRNTTDTLVCHAIWYTKHTTVQHYYALHTIISDAQLHPTHFEWCHINTPCTLLCHTTTTNTLLHLTHIYISYTTVPHYCTCHTSTTHTPLCHTATPATHLQLTHHCATLLHLPCMFPHYTVRFT